MPKTKWFDRRFDFPGSAPAFAAVLDRLRAAPDRVAAVVSGLPGAGLVARVDGIPRQGF